MKNLTAKYSCNAIAIQCWNALQGEIGIMPCAANSLLNEEGIPVVCETDIHGAITALMVEAAGRNDKRSFFADWTVRHPDNENGKDEYVLMYDMYTSGRYEYQTSTDLYHFSEPKAFTKDFFPRHGSVISLTRDELQRLQEKWGYVVKYEFESQVAPCSR